MECPACGAETLGLNHNNRGLRCTNCWELLPVEGEAPEVEAEEEKPEEAEAEIKDAPKPAPKKKQPAAKG